MKPSTSLITTLSFLLWISFTTTKPLSLASGYEPVLDVNGDSLVPGQEYYIVSAIWGAGGGGVRPQRTGDSSCSYSVTQEQIDLNQGVPVKFRIPGQSTGKISEGSTRLEIEFVEKPACAESSKWGIVYQPGSSLSSSSKVVIGGPKDHPDASFVRGTFQIERLNPVSYKLVFCPIFNFRHSNSCYNVAIEYQGRYRQLVLKDIDKYAFMVVFRKAAGSGEGRSII